MTTSLNPKPLKRHKWFIDTKSFKDSNKQVANPNILDINPPGYTSLQNFSQDAASKDIDPALIVKRSWEIALGSAKKIPMNMVIMYMSGNSISLFPIMVVGMLLIGPIKSILTIKSTFKMIEGDQAGIQKFVYFLGNIGNILLALYKCAAMGLLPTHPSDWLSFIQVPPPSEYAGGGFIIE